MISILYESDEWSNRTLADYLRASCGPVQFLNVADTDVLPQLPESGVIINRVFPSASLRGNEKALINTDEIIRQSSANQYHWINSAESFKYDCSKLKTYNALRGAIPELKIPAYLPQRDWRRHLNRLQSAKNGFCRKKDCGGRSQDFSQFSSITEFEDKIEEFNLQPGGYLIQEYIPPVLGYTTRVELIGGKLMTSLKRFIGDEGISSYSRGSRYEVYNDLHPAITAQAIAAAGILKMEMVSFDFIEDDAGQFWLIDVNGTSNFTPDYCDLLGFDPIKKMADFIMERINATNPDLIKSAPVAL